MARTDAESRDSSRARNDTLQPCRSTERDRIREQLRERGIATSTLYSPSVHLQPVYRALGLGPGSFPAAEALARELLCLPMHPGLTDGQVDFVSTELARAVAGETAALAGMTAHRERFPLSRLDGRGG